MIHFGYLPSGALAGMEPDSLCALLAGIGYTGIELLPDLILCEPEKQKKMLTAVSDHGLTISEVVLQKDFVIPDESERESSIRFILDAIPRVADIGVHTVNLFTGPCPWMPSPVIVGRDVTQSTAWGWVFNAFDRILPVAEKYRMNIAVENVWGMLAHDIYTNMFLQKHYDSRYLGVNLDPSHDILCGNTDMRFLVESWGKERIFHVHLKDAVGIPVAGKFTFPLLGEGEVNWSDFFTALSDIGYDGYASVEFESWNYITNILGGSNVKCAEISFDAIQKLAKNIKV